MLADMDNIMGESKSVQVRLRPRPRLAWRALSGTKPACARAPAARDPWTASTSPGRV